LTSSSYNKELSHVRRLLSVSISTYKGNSKSHMVKRRSRLQRITDSNLYILVLMSLTLIICLDPQ